MNYDLAKQLKDAGFPNEHSDGDECHIKGCYFGDNFNNYEVTHSPTLSELIEGCGDEFGHLAYWKGGNDAGDWNAIGWTFHGNEWGKTPEEAVARLWLALNKKDE